jgi:hypothetical protein
LAYPFNGRNARAHGLRNFFIGQLLVGFEQNPGAGEFAPTRFPTATQAQQLIAFRRRQLDMVLFHRSIDLLVSRFPSSVSCRSSPLKSSVTDY